MSRSENLPLTETAYYILLALTEPGHGYAVMKKVEELSGGQVRMAAGTMYGAIEILLKKGLIAYVPGADSRRKTYRTTELGKKVLIADYKRMSHMLVTTWELLEEVNS